MARVQDLSAIGLDPNKAKHLGWDSDYDISTTGNDSQANAYQLTASINFFGTVGATANSAKAPKAATFSNGFICGINSGANSINLYPYDGDNFNDSAANTKFVVLAGSAFLFWKRSSTSWIGWTFAANGY